MTVSKTCSKIKKPNFRRRMITWRKWNYKFLYKENINSSLATLFSVLWDKLFGDRKQKCLLSAIAPPTRSHSKKGPNQKSVVEISEKAENNHSGVTTRRTCNLIICLSTNRQRLCINWAVWAEWHRTQASGSATDPRSQGTEVNAPHTAHLNSARIISGIRDDNRITRPFTVTNWSRSSGSRLRRARQRPQLKGRI